MPANDPKKPSRRKNASSTKKLPKATSQKINKINAALNAKDTDALRKLTITRGGFINNDLRKRAWPLLLHVNVDEKHDEKKEKGDAHPQPRDANQVALDVKRSLTHILPRHTPEKYLLRLRTELEDVLLAVLGRFSFLNYYQGYHDIASTLLLTLSAPLTTKCLPSLTLTHLRDYLTPTLAPTLSLLSLLFPLISLCSPSTHTFLSQIPNLPPYFCLPWIITWFSHDIPSLPHITRLFDFFIASNPIMPLYVAAAIVVGRKEDLLQQEPEYDTVHHFLSRLVLDINVESVVRQAQKMFEAHPPEVLQRVARYQLHKASCVNRYRVDVEKLDPGQAIKYHVAEKMFWRVAKSEGGEKGDAASGPVIMGRRRKSYRTLLEGPWVQHARQVAWVTAFAATTAAAWYAYEIGWRYGTGLYGT